MVQQLFKISIPFGTLFPELSACGPLSVSQNNHGSTHLSTCEYSMSGLEASKIKNSYLRTDF